MKQIHLASGHVALIDDDDLERVSLYKWRAQPHPTTVYVVAHGKPKGLRLHRFVMNAPDGVIVDHINGNGLDCRKNNLRFATYSQNSQNSQRRRHSLSQYKGITWVPARQRWVAQIWINNRRERLGIFTNEIDAAKTYDAAALFYFGEFARVNFADSQPLSIQEIKKRNRENFKKRSASAFRGVTWRKDEGRWHARIQLNKKKISVGFYATDVEAAMAYDLKALDLLGPQADLNFPNIKFEVSQ
jgi:hypothetical protein